MNISDLLLFDLLFPTLLFYSLRIYEGNKIQLINFSCSFARTKLVYGSVSAFNRYLRMLSTLLFNFVKLRSSPFSFRVRSDPWVVLTLSSHLFLLYKLVTLRSKNRWMKELEYLWFQFRENQIAQFTTQFPRTVGTSVRIFLFNVLLNKAIFYQPIYIILSIYYSSIQTILDVERCRL